MATPTVRTVANRLTALYERADSETLREGREWYNDANAVAHELAAAYGLSIEQTAYVIAALSPNVNWTQNQIGARYACDGFASSVPSSEWRGAGYGSNKLKAARILSGDLSALTGPKVTEFARGILGSPDACTVDVWMQRAAGMDSGRAPNKTQHEIIRRALSIAAKRAGETVRDFQAIVWIQTRKEWQPC